MSRHSTLLWFTAALALAASGCKGKDKDEKQARTPPVEAPKTQAPKTEAPRVAPKTQAPANPIAAALVHASRPQADKDRDAGRKPAEVLAFFDIQPGMKVADLLAFGGYYSELLGRVVGPEGKVIAHNIKLVGERFPDAQAALVDRLDDPELAKAMEIKVSEFDDLQLPGDLDAVFMVLAYHDMAVLGADRAAVNKQIFDALRPGGIYAVIDHHGAPGNAFKDAETLHRGDADATKSEILAAGFELAGESNVLRVPEDKRDIYAVDATIRGKTDRFVYKFKKPAAQ